MSLLYRPLESITAADLQALVDNKVGEGLYIEYKTEVFDKRDDKKRLQFLGSVSAFANAAGGDLLVGVKADHGLPVEMPGLDPVDVDSEILRITQVVGTNIEPQVMLHLQPVRLPTGRCVLVIRIPRSWMAPHGIEQNGHFQFFRRHSAGRSPMTLSELRTAFTFSDTIVQQTRRFRSERLAIITAAEGPWGYLDKPLAVLHVIPFAGIMEALNLDFSKNRSFRKLNPLPARGGIIDGRPPDFNLDGVVMRQETCWHTQLFRNGSIEYATTVYFDQTRSPYYLDAWNFQVDLLIALTRFFTLLGDVGVAPPVTVMLSILNASNFHLRTSEGSMERAMSGRQIDRSEALLPEVVLNDFSEDPITAMKSTFDCLWNAAGLERCRFYRSNGEWKLDPSWLDPPNTP